MTLLVKTIKALILILIVALFIPVSLSSRQKRFVYSSRIGVVSVEMDDQLCFDIKNPNLFPGDHVKIIDLVNLSPLQRLQ
jgi:hypothetical protein